MTASLNNSDKNLSLGLNPNFNTEVSHVQYSNQNIDDDDLRALVSNVVWAKEHSRYISKIVNHCLGHILSNHKELIADSLGHQLSLFSGANFNETTPLWMKLIYRQHGGLRQVSSDWLQNAKNFLKQLDPSSTIESIVTQNINDPFIAYRLGLLDIATNLISSRPNIYGHSLEQKIAIATDTFDEQSIDVIKNQHSADFHNEGLLASYLVQQMKRGRSIDFEIITHLENRSLNLISEFNCNMSDDLLVRLCHILNSLNFIWTKLNRRDQIELCLKNIEVIATAIKEYDLRLHVLGNIFYHKAILSKISGNQDQELHYLQEASQLDSGFTDYHYRMAQILHDRGDIKAKEQYELAIRTSPFNLAVINDYGFFLNEYGSSEELESWEKVATFFFKANEDVSTYE